MNVEWRWIVAVVILVFSWKGADIDFPWPPEGNPAVQAPKPPAECLAWAEPLRAILPKMVVKDRLYLANLYEAMAFVLVNDGDRPQPIISDTTKFSTFHAGTLNLAVKRANVGKYAGLGEAIDQVFMAAIGPDERKLDDETRNKLVVACGTLSWTFSVGRDE